MTPAARVSYVFIAAIFALAAATHLATPLVAVLFSYFALRKLRFSPNKWLSLAVFLVLIAVILYGIGVFVTQAVVALPKIAAESIPPLIDWAQRHGFQLPFSDLDSLKTTTADVAKDEFLFVGNFARSATRQLVFAIIAIVVAMSLFVRSKHQTVVVSAKPSLA